MLGLKLTVGTSLVLATTLIFGKTAIAGLYSANAEVIAIAASLLGWVAFYHVADSTQALCAFLLRCYRITFVPLALYGVLLWGLGLYGGYTLTYVGLGGTAAVQSASGFWAASTLAIGLVALCFAGLLGVVIGRTPTRTTSKTA